MIPPEEARKSAGILTEEEFAAMMRVTMQTLAIWRVKGYGPNYAKLGRKPFYRIEDVKHWVIENTVAPVNTLGSRAAGVPYRDEHPDQLELDI